MSVYVALDRLKGSSARMGLVCDEHGSLCGIITPADILDGLVGEDAPSGAVRLSAPGADGGNVWSVDPRLNFYDFLRRFDREEHYEPDPSYATLGGFLLERFRHLPSPGERLEWKGIRFEIAAIRGARILQVLVSFPEVDAE